MSSMTLQTTLCAGDGTGDNDACDGDSGEPLVCKRNKDTEIFSNSYVMVGIVICGGGGRMWTA